MPRTGQTPPWWTVTQTSTHANFCAESLRWQHACHPHRVSQQTPALHCAHTHVYIHTLILFWPTRTCTRKRTPPPFARYSTKLFRNHTIAIIEEHAANHADKPLFLYLPFQAVHAPLQATPHWLSMQHPASAFNNDTDRRTYAAMVANMDFAVMKIIGALHDNNMYNDTVFILSADNGGIQGTGGAGYNYPLRGQKATYWDGGMRAVGFISSPLLPKTGYSYHGLMHVTDWMPTIVGLGGGNVQGLKRDLDLDGFDMWAPITTNATSPRTELLHNIDVFGGLGKHGVGNAAIRMGELKLIVGNPGTGEWFIPPGCSPTICTVPNAPAGAACAPDNASTSLWLFDIDADERETCNLVDARPEDAARLMARLVQLNATQVPVLYPANDPRSDPANRTGAEKGVWGPWE